MVPNPTPSAYETWLLFLAAYTGQVIAANDELAIALYRNGYEPDKAADEILQVNLFGGTNVH